MTDDAVGRNGASLHLSITPHSLTEVGAGGTGAEQAPVPPSAQPSVKDMVARIIAERGPFKSLREADLQRSVDQGNEFPAGSKSDAQQADGLGMAAVKQTIVDCLMQAQNECVLALDTISLACPQDSDLAASTVSPFIRQELPRHALDRYPIASSASTLSEQDAHVACGLLQTGIKAAVSTITLASDKLKGEAAMDSLFWKDLVRISRAGWPVTPVRNRPGAYVTGFDNLPIWILTRGDKAVKWEPANTYAKSLVRYSVLDADTKSAIACITSPDGSDLLSQDQMLLADATLRAVLLFNALRDEARASDFTSDEPSFVIPIDDKLMLKAELVPLDQVDAALPVAEAQDSAYWTQWLVTFSRVMELVGMLPDLPQKRLITTVQGIVQHKQQLQQARATLAQIEELNIETDYFANLPIGPEDDFATALRHFLALSTFESVFTVHLSPHVRVIFTVRASTVPANLPAVKSVVAMPNVEPHKELLSWNISDMSDILRWVQEASL